MKTCPKCGEMNVSVTYKQELMEEWLKYTCWTCGFTKYERPKDYNESNIEQEKKT